MNELIKPIEDDARDVRWWQYVNEFGTHMTKVVCRKTGWSVVSNQYAVGGLAEPDLDQMVKWLRSETAQLNAEPLQTA